MSKNYQFKVFYKIKDVVFELLNIKISSFKDEITDSLDQSRSN